MLTLPTWIMTYARRRPRLGAPLVSTDYAEAEVGALDRDGAAATFTQVMGMRGNYEARIVSIHIGSGTGPA